MRYLRLFVFIAIALMAQTAFAEDYIQCSQSQGRILCNLIIPDFVNSVSSILTNGWENTIQIHISLLDRDGRYVVMRSRLEATQRCYLDPFESPCLILWRGASHWQRYRGEAAFLTAMKHFGIQALKLKDIEPAEYVVRITVQVMASAQKRLESIRGWFKSGGSESGFSVFSPGGLISSFLGSRAEETGDQVNEITLETFPFPIDVGSPSTQDVPES